MSRLTGFTVASRRMPVLAGLVLGVALLLALMAAPGRAAAATTSSCDYASGTSAPGGGKDASGLCWIDWSAYNDTTASSTAGQPFTLNLGSGYTASFTITHRPNGANPNVPVSGEPAGSSPNGNVGCTAAGGFNYQNAPGSSRLYTDWAGGCTAGPAADELITLSNISVTDPAGKPVSGYSLVTRDAETTNSQESAGANAFTWSSNAPLTVFDASVPQLGADTGCPANPPGAGTTTVTCQSSPSVVGTNLALQATNPTTLSVLIHTEAREAVAFAFETAKVTLNKTVSGREKSGDSFGLSTGDPQGSTIGSGTTGSADSASTGTTTVLPLSGTSDAYSLAEAAGSGTDLSDYTHSWACSNASAGSTTALPSGSGTSNTVDPAVGDDITCAITNSAAADLSIVKTASTSPAQPGENETYTLAVKNNGPNPASGATVSDPLPAGESFVSASPGCSFASGTVTCAAGDMAVGQAKTFTVTAKVADSQTAALKNTATVHSPTPDPNSGNNTSTTTTPVAKADLSIVKSTAAKTVVAGTNETYKLVVHNNGPDTAENVSVSDPLPKGLSFVSASKGCSEAHGTVTCTASSLKSGATLTYRVTAKVASSVDHALDNTATVHSHTPDPNPGNDTSTTHVPTTGEADLSIVKTASVPSAPVGGR